MSSYAFAANWNNRAGLVALNPQPASSGLLIPEFETGSLGLAVAQGRLYTSLNYNDLDVEDYINLLIQLGLSRTVTSRKGTFRLRDHDGGYWVFKNGYINYPQGRRRMVRWENVQFLVTGLRDLT
jgi:hypothetical protein